MSYDEDLTQEEREALGQLPREREPSSLLEERTVRALRNQGMLSRTTPVGRSWITVAAAVAAGAVLYLGGIATGQWMSNRQTANTLAAIQRNNAMQAAMLVQRTGSAYAQAIAALSHVPDSTDRQYLVQGREVALTALYAAANEVVRLAPDDPVVGRILQVLDHDRDRADSAFSEPHRVVWF